MSEEAKQDVLWLGAPQAAGKLFLSLHCTGKQPWLTLEGNFLTEERQSNCFQEEGGLF